MESQGKRNSYKFILNNNYIIYLFHCEPECDGAVCPCWFYFHWSSPWLDLDRSIIVDVIPEQFIIITFNMYRTTETQDLPYLI